MSSSQQTEDRGGGEEEEEEEEEEAPGRRRGGDGARRGRRATSEGGGAGGEERRRLRWRINQLEKEKLQLSAEHNQEVCGLQAELTRLRSAVERGEAQGAELQYQLTVSRRDKRSLTERAARLQQEVDAARRADRQHRQDLRGLQQEVEERRRLVERLSADGERLQRALQEQEEALQEASRRRQEQQRETQRMAEEVKLLMEREERSRMEKETLQSSLGAERDAHLETRYSCEIIQLRLRDAEAALAAARSGQQEAQCQLVEEQERRGGAERTLQRLQAEYERCRAERDVAVETERRTTSDLCRRLEEEAGRHAGTQALLQQALQARSAAEEASRLLLLQVEEALRPHGAEAPPARHHGSPAEDTMQRLDATLTSYQLQLQEVRSSSVRQQEEIQTLQLLRSQQEAQLQEAQQEVIRLQEEVSDWSIRSQELKAELEREKEEKEERERREKEKEEKEERERREKEKEVQQLIEQHQKQTMACLSSLHTLYQRLLAGCVLLPQSMLGNFTCQELCDVISEQVEQLTSDLQAANQKVVRLQCVCNRKTVCVRELQRNHKCVLSRLEESVRRREEEHTHTLSQLQLQKDSLTSDLSESRGRGAALLAACGLLGGALRHAHLRLRSLCQQKALLRRRLEAREQLEEEVKRLAEALRGEEEEEEEQEEEQERRRRSRRRWRRSVWVVLAVRRWRELGRRSTVLLRVEGGGGAPAVCVCGDGTGDGGDGGRWLSSERLSSAVLSAVSHLRDGLDHHGSAHLMPAARSALSRLLQHFLDQSQPGPAVDGDASRASRADAKAPVAALQRHFLLFSQRLHSAEVERRGLRLEVANLRRGLQQETVSAQRFHSVCEELRQALSREDEAQSIIREQSNKLHTHTSEQAHTQRTLSHAAQELSRKQRSLRIVGKHLSEVQRARRRAEAELSAAARRRDRLIGCLKAAETSCQQVRDSLVQSGSSMTQPRPLLVSQQLSGAESMMGTPEMDACQAFLSAVTQLCHAYSCRIHWLQQEVSAHPGHVTALQDACLRDNQAFVPVAGFEDALPLADAGSPPPSLAEAPPPPQAPLNAKGSEAPVRTH